MGTSALIHFRENKKIFATIYRHYDGYPEEVLNNLEQFLDAVEKQCIDRRFNDPTYLAAKFVVWQADQYTDDKSKPLDFLSVGVVTPESLAGDYYYYLDCDTRNRPEIIVGSR